MTREHIKKHPNETSNYFDKNIAVLCYVTDNRGYLGDYTEFDVIAFNGPKINVRHLNNLPARLNTPQKYVYADIEASEQYPICSKTWNKYFNWTWTYRLDSSSIWRYFGRLKTVMHWMDTDKINPIDKDLKINLSTKTKPAALFVSNCATLSLRDEKVIEIHVTEILVRFHPRLRDLRLKGNAKELGTRKTAETMFPLTHRPTEYAMFVRWKKFYSYQYTDNRPDRDVYCEFCETLLKGNCYQNFDE